jgi:hypothetical protein
MHPDDAALALAGALEKEEAWNRILLVGGGPSCQVTYRDDLWKLLTRWASGPLPEEAFSGKDYFTDWLDSTEGAAALRLPAPHLRRHRARESPRAWAGEVPSCRSRPHRAAVILRMSKYYGKSAAA